MHAFTVVGALEGCIVAGCTCAECFACKVGCKAGVSEVLGIKLRFRCETLKRT